MAKHSRLTNLKSAAQAFVNVVTERAANSPGLTTVSVVPYSMTVNLGPELADLYNVVPLGDGFHDASSCILLSDEDFAGTSLPTTRPLAQYPHFDPDDGDGTADGGYLGAAPGRIAMPLCPRSSETDPGANPLTPLGTDAGRLRAAIAALVPYDATGIDAGVRWGVAMLDPSARPAVDGLVASGAVDAAASGRPFDYGREDTLKVLVLMTDGDPDGQRTHPDELLSGWSNVWRDTVTGRYSVLVRGRHLRDFDYVGAKDVADGAACADHWADGALASAEEDGIRRVAPSPIDDTCPPHWYWADHSNGAIGKTGWKPSVHEFRDHPDSSRVGTSSENDWSLLGTELVRLTNREVYDHFTGHDAVEFLYRPIEEDWLSGAEWEILRVLRYATHDPDEATTRLLTLCTAAKAADRGILIFTVGFELDRVDAGARRDRAYRIMEGCATSPGHFHDVTSLMEDGAIGEAFAVIASQIQPLRLTR
jgi:hypothetical protein